MDKLRLRFEKIGRAVYISHLDLMQTMQRAFFRADYALKYSEGFNPHPQISIALPLAVGTGSLCELMDFRLNEEPDLKSLPERLTRVMPEGIVITEAYEPVRKFAELKWIQVEGILEYDERDLTEMAEKLRIFYEQPEIIIIKKTKRGMGETDIQPAIKQISFSAGNEAVRLEAVISAQEPTLNPELLAEALRQRAPKLAPDFAKFQRIETYDKDMNLFR